jgi:hypothetical protein
MSIDSFFWLITFLLVIILAYVSFTGEAEAQSIIHPMLDVQIEQIEKYGEQNWKAKQEWIKKKNWYQQWGKVLDGQLEKREIQNPLMEVWIQKDDFYIIATLYLVAEREDLICPRDSSGYRASGCYRYADESIWILNGWEDNRTKLGCSILWHEILHGQGLSHGEMEHKYDNWVCSV